MATLNCRDPSRNVDRKGTQASLFSIIWSSFALQVSFPVAFLGGVTPSRHDVTAAGGGAGPGGAAAPSAGTGLRAHGGQTPRRDSSLQGGALPAFLFSVCYRNGDSCVLFPHLKWRCSSVPSCASSGFISLLHTRRFFCFYVGRLREKSKKHQRNKQ